MKRYNLIYARFLDYLRECGGCLGPRKSEHCKYAVVCAVVEVLGKKGLVSNSKDLLHYGTNDRNKYNYLPEGCGGADHDGERSDAGPCSGE